MERNGNKCEKKSGKEREVKERRGKDRIRKKNGKRLCLKNEILLLLLQKRSIAILIHVIMMDNVWR